MASYPDAYLNYWSDVYAEGDLNGRGVSLEQFLANPRRSAALRGDPNPRRLQEVDPLDGDDPATEVRDGRLIEKMRHGARSQRPTPWAQRFAHKLRRVLS